MYDVIVIGSGPAGSLAAKKCAEMGLRSLLLEEKTLPRDKVCSGMVMGVMAQELIQREFGPIPDKVLTNPSHLRGLMVYAPGAEPQIVEWKMPFAWRRDLDFWMAQRAKQAGAELRDGAKVTSVEQHADSCLVRLGKEALTARFVIGADGTSSTIRKQLYPEAQFVSRAVYRECYQGGLSLDRNYYHWFLPQPLPRPRFNVNHKGEFFIIEGGLKQLRSEIVRLLRPFGFRADQIPVWKDGCMTSANLKEGLSAGSFTLGRGNILLAGDAGMAQLPVAGEGIGTALKSGLLAAQSVAEAISSKRAVEEIYRHKLEPLVNVILELFARDRKIDEASQAGPKGMAGIAFANGLRATLEINVP